MKKKGRNGKIIRMYDQRNKRDAGRNKRDNMRNRLKEKRN
jgi:hypothetical protein